MKTYEFAQALTRLAKLLQSLPNTEMSEFEERVKQTETRISTEGIAVNLATLAALSRIDKQQWVDFITEYRLPIMIRPTKDASRDILGKLLKYLENNPDAQERLKQRADSRSAEASPELMRALDVLLRNKKQ